MPCVYTISCFACLLSTVCIITRMTLHLQFMVIDSRIWKFAGASVVTSSDIFAAAYSIRCLLLTHCKSAAYVEKHACHPIQFLWLSTSCGWALNARCARSVHQGAFEHVVNLYPALVVIYNHISLNACFDEKSFSLKLWRLTHASWMSASYRPDKHQSQRSHILTRVSFWPQGPGILFANCPFTYCISGALFSANTVRIFTRTVCRDSYLRFLWCIASLETWKDVQASSWSRLCWFISLVQQARGK